MNHPFKLAGTKADHGENRTESGEHDVSDIVDNTVFQVGPSPSQ
jgi:hypothetical protein